MIEIERKFLVHADLLPDLSSFEKFDLRQGYLQKNENLTIRVRIANEKGFLTLKSKSIGFSRQEFEYEIPVNEALELLPFCGNNVLEKTRYIIPSGNRKWELDIFSGKLDGLILAEIELEKENEIFTRPSWLGTEVSLDSRYFNSSLSQLSEEECRNLLASEVIG